MPTAINRFAFPVQAYEMLNAAIANVADPAVRDVMETLARMSHDRDRALEDHLSRIHEVVVFSYPGVITTGTPSPTWHARWPLTFGSVRLSRLVAGASNVLIDVEVNAAIISTVTLLAGATSVLSVTPIPVNVGDAVSVNVNTQGDGADVSVALIPD